MKIHIDNEVEFYNKLWTVEWQDMERFNPTACHLEMMIVRLIETVWPVKDILDVGCGMGVNLKRVRMHFPDLNLAGSDLSDNILKIAELYVGKDTEYIKLDIGKEKLDRTFDMVLCSQVLEHIEDDMTAFKNMAAMCERYLLITVPGGTYNSTSKLVGHHRHYKREELVGKVVQCGFRIRHIRQWGFPFHSIYKRALALLPQEYQKRVGFGKYGLFKKSISNLLYYLFFGNVFNMGANIILLAEKNKRG